jgi:hypothetical protein
MLGDNRNSTTQRGVLLAEWLLSSGLRCWNATKAYGVPTYYCPRRLTRAGAVFSSIIDLMITSGDLIEPALQVRSDLSMGSDHHPVSLSFIMPQAPPPPSDHPRLLWHLSKLSHRDCKYASIFSDRVHPLMDRLQQATDSPTCPDINGLAVELTDLIHSCLDDSIGKKKPGAPGNAWFWNDTLQKAADYREKCRRRWQHESDCTKKVAKHDIYLEAAHQFKIECKRRKRQTWKAFCYTLATSDYAITTGIIKRIRRNRVTTPQFMHTEGPAAAALAMSRHLRNVFAGDTLPENRQPALPVSPGPHPLTFPASPNHNCPIDAELVDLMIRKRLARKKAPGIDHLRTEMLVPLGDPLVNVLVLLFQLCWKWSKVPEAWTVAQVVPIYKKGSPLDAGNFRPISLTSVFRKLLELCLQDQLIATAPELDIVQGGFRANRSAMDQALCLHELCEQHAADHYHERPVLAFLDIKSAYDTVDRTIIWRALELFVSAPLLSLLQSMFDSVQIQVLVQGEASPAFWPSTGVLQGSILSPFLYSVYINSLPEFLRGVRLPKNRSFDMPPRCLFNDLWINSLLYADDVVLIGTADSMPRLLRRAEEHSTQLGYRWNPDKCVIVNSPTVHGSSPLKLYGSAIPTATSFTYLGLPIDNKGKLNTGLLLQRNIQSALGAMRGGLQPLGLSSTSFSRLTAARLYTTFIRPKMEYGLAISLYLAKELKSLEKAQDQCLRMLFRGHRTASTAVFKHMTNLPSMEYRVDRLVFKMVCRIKNLPEDTLLSVITRACSAENYRWPKLVKNSTFWNTLPPSPTVRTRVSDNPTFQNKHCKEQRQQAFTAIITRTAPPPPVLLSACRKQIGIDPILFLPMTIYERSRLVRWRMGWLPARPLPCSKCGGVVHASRTHLLACLSVASRLNITGETTPNPLDYFLNNFLPTKKPVLLGIRPLTAKQAHLVQYWPELCQILLEMDQICLPDEEFPAEALAATGSQLLSWYQTPTE